MLAEQGILIGSQRSEQHSGLQQAMVQAIVRLAAFSAPLNPRDSQRGFFVSFYYWFRFYFSGYRQTPARAGARTMLE